MIHRMMIEAKQLKREGILGDPSDDDILIAAAECAGYDGDLTRLHPIDRYRIIAAYDSQADLTRESRSAKGVDRNA